MVDGDYFLFANIIPKGLVDGLLIGPEKSEIFVGGVTNYGKSSDCLNDDNIKNQTEVQTSVGCTSNIFSYAIGIESPSMYDMIGLENPLIDQQSIKFAITIKTKLRYYGEVKFKLVNNSLTPS